MRGLLVEGRHDGEEKAGLALVSLALLAPAAARRRRKAAEPYKVLVVTSTSDASTAAGISAITAAVGADGVVTAPAPADCRRRSSRPRTSTRTAPSCS